MICCSNRHPSFEMGRHNVASVVYGFALKGCKPSALFPVPAHASDVLVLLVSRAVYASQVAQAVVRAIAVDVVNLFRLPSCAKKPREAMGKKRLALMGNADVAGSVKSSTGAELAAPIRFYAGYNAAIRVVGEVFSYRFWDTFESHIKLTFDVVRGSVVGATDTPILHYLRHPGASQGITFMAPCLLIR